MVEARTKSDEKALEDGCYFDPKPAEYVRSFLRKFCKQSIGKWAGKPLELLDWQWNELIKPLYGWRKKDGSRRFTQAGIWIPKNNGKSTLLSGLSLYHLVADREPAAQVICIASSIEQANIVYREAASMVESSPDLDSALWVRRNIKTIQHDKSGSLLKVFSGERGSMKSGHAISFCVFDELADQKSSMVWDQMRQNAAKRDNSLLISISTAGFRRESIGYEMYSYASKVLSGEIVDTSFLPVIHAADPSDDWTALDTFRKANPSAPQLISDDKARELITEAKNEPRKESAYKTLRLNLWVGASTTWISSQKWAECKHVFNEEDCYGKKVKHIGGNELIGSETIIGLDSSYKHDLASYVIIAPNLIGNLVLVPRFFIPRKMVERKEKMDKVPYYSWYANPRNNLHFTEGDVIDPSYIRKCLVEDCERFGVDTVYYDPTGFEESRQLLEKDHGLNMVSVPQTPKIMGPAAAQFERLVMGNKILHPNNPILNWCLENCAVKEQANGLYVYKGSGDTQRIDGIIATIIGIAGKTSQATIEDNTPQVVFF